MSYAPFARIALRYVVGGVIMGSPAIGEKLAADPDMVMAGAALIGVCVEGVYAIAKRKGWNT